MAAALIVAQRARATRVLICVGCVAALLAKSPATAAPPDSNQTDVALRVEWGDGPPRRWRVRLWTAKGLISSPRRLGLTADTPGNWLVEPRQILITQGLPRTYDGFEFRWTADLDATLTLEASPLDGEDEPRRLEASMRDLLMGGKRLDLPGRGSDDNKLLIRRAPGDSLRVGLDAPSLVFGPSQPVTVIVQPHHTELEPGSYRLRVTVEAEGGAAVWTQEQELRVGPDGSAEPWQLPLELPAEEGVYDLHAEIVRRRLTAPFVRTTPLLDRKLQLAVIGSETPAARTESWRVVADIDPAQPNKPDWIDRITGLKVLFGSGLQKPFGSGDSVVERDGKSVTLLAAGGWKAFPLPIAQPGQPHIVEIDMPGSAGQSMGVGILERNATGAYAPLRFEAGVDLLPASSAAVRQYRLAYWPRGETPLLLLSNLSPKSPALFASIRVHAGPLQLSAANQVSGGAERLAAAYLDQPWFSDVFGGQEALDPTRASTLDDWRTFYQGGQRLTQYLHYVGYNAAVLCVARDGGALYPSPLLQPSPRFDSGLFFASGQDPVSKDVLEMLFRMFDREGLKLIPAIHFSGSLPELESLRLRQGDTSGLLLVGPDGRPKGNTNGAPAYNPLDPRVSLAMRRVIRELVDRYSHHASFGGVSLQLSPLTSAQLPGELWGLDEATFARFQRDLGLQETADDLAGRIALVRGSLRSAWLRWRSDKMTEWYLSLRDDLIATRSDAMLQLATADMFQIAELETHLRPRLTGAGTVENAAVGAGLQLDRLREQPGLAVLRPYRIGAPLDLAGQAVNVQTASSSEVDLNFCGPEDRRGYHAAGSIFFHEPRPHTILDFRLPDDAEPAPLSVTAHISPGEAQVRRWLVRSLAAYDPQQWLVGGWSPPLGQEAFLRELLLLYRRLPVASFLRVEPERGDDHTQPLTVRQARVRGRTFVYVVNDSPWPFQAELSIRTSLQTVVHSLDSRPCEPLVFGNDGPRWQVTLDPYDVRAIWLDSPNAQVLNWRVANTDELAPQLQRRVREVQARANSVAPRKFDALVDPGFEHSDWADSQAWRFNTQSGVQVLRDVQVHQGGQAALRLRSSGPVAWVRSNAFPAPPTGRLYVQVQMRVADPSQQPRLRVSVDSGRGFYSYLPVGAETSSYRLGETFSRRYLFPFDNIPADVTQLQIGFDLMGVGDVWIDDVQLYDIWFEGQELSKLIHSAALVDMGLLKKAKVGACQDFLDDYWSQFLMRHVELDSQPHVAIMPRGEPAADQQAPVQLPVDTYRSPWQRMRDLLPKSPLRRR